MIGSKLKDVKVDLKKPKCAVLVHVFRVDSHFTQAFCCLSVIPHWDELNELNLRTNMPKQLVVKPIEVDSNIPNKDWRCKKVYYYYY